MRGFIGISQVFVYVLLVGSLSGGAAAQDAPSGPHVKVCLSEDGTPTESCVQPRRLGLRLASIETKRHDRAIEADLVLEVGPDGLDMIGVLAGMNGGGERIEICIVNGGLICPPEQFEVVWICITTGMLAGSECPDPLLDTPGPITTIWMRASPR